MKDILKIAVVLALAFASTFFLVQWSGLIPEAGVVAWLEGLQAIDPWWLVAGVIVLLLLDLLVAIPTMTTILLAGWLLGPLAGGLAASAGLMLMGCAAYGMGRGLGRPVLARMFREPDRLAAIEAAFSRHDMLVLVVCQALPILPELSATLAGIARMPLRRFLPGYAAGVVPFAFIVVAGGAASSPDDLRPAILTAIATSATLLVLWRILAARASGSG